MHDRCGVFNRLHRLDAVHHQSDCIVGGRNCRHEKAADQLAHDVAGIVIPVIIQIFTLPLIYKSLLAEEPENVIRLGGGLMICAAISVLFVRVVGNDALGQKVGS